MPTSRRIVDSQSEDFYPTPEWITRGLLSVETFMGPIWEPACGNGAISKILEELRGEVYSTDLYYRGYGDLTSVDFTKASLALKAENIVTNPPYNLAEEFVHSGLRLAESKLALLLRLSFLESARRYNSIFSKRPPNRVWVSSERITFYPNGLQTAGTGTLAYAWFVWDKQAIHSETRLGWILPGFKTDSKPIADPSLALDIEL